MATTSRSKIQDIPYRRQKAPWSQVPQTVQTAPRAHRPRIGKPSTKINFPGAGDVQSSVRTAALTRVLPRNSPADTSRVQSQDFDQVWRSRQELLELAGIVPLADREDFQHVSDTPQEFFESWFQTSNNCCLRPRPADVCCISIKKLDEALVNSQPSWRAVGKPAALSVHLLRLHHLTGASSQVSHDAKFSALQPVGYS